MMTAAKRVRFGASSSRSTPKARAPARQVALELGGQRVAVDLAEASFTLTSASPRCSSCSHSSARVGRSAEKAREILDVLPLFRADNCDLRHITK